MSVKEKLEKKLKESKSLSSEDVNAAAVKKEIKDDESGKSVVDAMYETTKIPIEDTDVDPVVKHAAELGSAKDAVDEVVGTAGNVNSFGFGLMRHEDIEVSPNDKQAFLDAITGVTEAPFMKPFELFNGRVNGVFRSRTLDESEALLKEINRQWQSSKDWMPIEYSMALRKAMLRFQLVELNGVQQPKVIKPLKAVVKILPNGEKEIEEPKWFTELEVLFGKMNEGLLQALFDELMMFERIYWTLIRHASDQNFWNPAEPTTE